ncbi:phasin family protein [Sphingomonas sp.]|uniref:phasin family protein n=1 Tax=Sphingomonas sp. TaxID=28214 RepID=UPI0035C7B84E
MANDQQAASGAAFGDQVKNAGETMRASGQKMADNTSSLGVAMIDQAQANAQEAFAAMRAAAQAKDLSDVMRIQGDYLREQSQRSMNQAREIGELIMKFGRDAVSPMQSGKSG